MFHGLIIRMYYAPDQHPPPHFHVYYHVSCSARVGVSLRTPTLRHR
ncbi:MAG: hypothetical protein COZ12_08415 [Deltaproteobacteria bacterium CG_4_10_14_3_um_filter_60_8]|nr:MAG: hypothetical protein COX17_05015 [Deltaproteobacteria bacterium CG23_combo_of_CG06-09_8_20_14_all_60_8]PIY20744.1 MAG: hypothetical protein COZ12_08415 [Deltaproteobacteria bacterium CG_4_10_14_3_um_filter_60_8]